MKIAMLGLPGAGKGTQSSKISDEYGIPAIGMGDLLRAERDAVIHYNPENDEFHGQLYFREDGSVRRNTNPDQLPEYMETLGERLDRGKGPSDETTRYFLQQELEKHDSYVLDGYPRWGDQAEHMDEMDDLDAVFLLSVSPNEIERRITGRRVCESDDCGENYHIEFNPPEEEGVCDSCDSDLYQREDSSPEKLETRIQDQSEGLAVVLEHYDWGDEVPVETIDGNPSPDEVWEDVEERVEEYVGEDV